MAWLLGSIHGNLKQPAVGCMLETDACESGEAVAVAVETYPRNSCILGLWRYGTRLRLCSVVVVVVFVVGGAVGILGVDCAAPWRWLDLAQFPLPRTACTDGQTASGSGASVVCADDDEWLVGHTGGYSCAEIQRLGPSNAPSPPKALPMTLPMTLPTARMHRSCDPPLEPPLRVFVRVYLTHLCRVLRPTPEPRDLVGMRLLLPGNPAAASASVASAAAASVMESARWSLLLPAGPCPLLLQYAAAAATFRRAVCRAGRRVSKLHHELF